MWVVTREQGGARWVQEEEVNDMLLSIELRAVNTIQNLFHLLQYSIYHTTFVFVFDKEAL